MSKCPNCGAKLGCGCQRRTAPDGKQICVKCVHTYKPSVQVKETK